MSFLNKEVDDFYFCDSEGIVFMDNLFVESILYPIKELKMKNSKKIYVVDTKEKLNQDLNHSVNSNKTKQKSKDENDLIQEESEDKSTTKLIIKI